jgi:hypothetical protein
MWWRAASLPAAERAVYFPLGQCADMDEPDPFAPERQTWTTPVFRAGTPT